MMLREAQDALHHARGRLERFEAEERLIEALRTSDDAELEGVLAGLRHEAVALASRRRVNGLERTALLAVMALGLLLSCFGSPLRR
jgi:hypothetical protein